MEPIAPYEVSGVTGLSGSAAARPRLLVVDDQPVNIQALYQVFSADHQVLMATTGEQALALCISKSPDLVLLDVEMPGMGGYEVCRRLKAEAATHDIPIIFVTAHSDEGSETRGLDAGAVDFISKPINPAIVRARVKTHLTLKSQGDLLRKWVYVDGMTGVYNRRFFDERLEAEWTRAMRANSALSVVLMDVDFFKGYNDQYGHPAGDDALRRVAAAMKTSLKRPGDLVARYGGEEFACLLSETPLAGALKVAERMCEQVRALAIAHADSSLLPVITVSLGVGCKPAGAPGSAVALLRLADAQLYLAKTSGRNRACGAELGAD